MSFRQLDSARILETIGQLAIRIEDRFPKSGLANVSRDLLALGNDCAIEAAAMSGPILWIRIAVVILAILMIALGVIVLAIPFGAQSIIPRQITSLGEYVQAVNAAVNNVIFLAIAVFFLFGLETRFKRRRALKSIHELRSIAHIVDMHQLTKDPERLAVAESSNVRVMTPDNLAAYLDFCTDVLSLTSKVAALYPQHFDDAVVLAAVNEVEDLTTGLSRKIWQKISIVQAAPPERRLVPT